MVARSSGPAIAEASDTVAVKEDRQEEAVRVAPTPGPALVTKHPRVIMGAVMMANMMQMVDSTIANVALPHMQASFSAALDQISWVLTSYILATAIATPLIGWLSSRFGRKHVYLASIAGFTAASM